MSKFKKGDEVRIVKAFPSMVEGLYYNPLMDNSVGKTGIILDKGKGEWWVVRVDQEEPYNWVESSLELVKKPINPMPELKSGMRVQHRNGDIYMVIKDLDRLFQINGFNQLKDFNVETGSHQSAEGVENKEWDIVKVFEGHTTSSLMNLSALGMLIWEERSVEQRAKEQKIFELQNKIADLLVQLKTLES